MRHDINPRLLRAFVAVAEELHFTRAAARLFVAQQALSRDIRHLERVWGRALFERDTRHVALTREGQRLLPVVRHVLTAQEQLGRELEQPPAGESARPLIVDVALHGSTGPRVLAAAREAAPGLEFVSRFHSGLTRAAAEMADGRLDVSFGRVAGLPRAVRAGLEHRLIRYDRLAVHLPPEHRLAALPRVPLAALAGETVYAAAGNEDTTEWTDYARALFAGRGIGLAPPFPKIEGEAEFRRVMRKHGWSVLANVDFADVPEMALRPLTDPVPLSPVSLVWRRGLRHPGVRALADAAQALGTAEGWLERPPDSWLPDADRTLAAEPSHSF
ncbi:MULTISPECIES: LysR family transcriptional regulator [Streptomyces]|uniref:LysR family transcriptional regulator n=1 Tax=Streptomyces kaempferi TaxID=333725 RepID=A0ABW3XV74_9ACTN|nr:MULTISPECIES: LysR family transcriptional regulator [unclassified Streptomyces]QIY60543.1 LysR family transcriptional regulator [Streptomyces sp. RPA4-2]